MKNNRLCKSNFKSKGSAYFFIALSFLVFLSPVATFASSSSSCKKPTDIGSVFDYAGCVISNSVIPFIIGLGVLLFLIGLVAYVAAGDNEEKRAQGRDLIIFGIIVIFVMVSVWGFVNLLISTFNLNNSYPGLYPDNRSWR